MVPLGAVLHNPPGSIGGRQPANTTMRPHMVVVVAPAPQHRAGMAERHETRLVEALVTPAAVEALDIAVLLRPEDSRGGKEWVSSCRFGWSPYHSQKKTK